MNKHSFGFYSYLDMVQKIIDIADEIGDDRVAKKVSSYLDSLRKALDASSVHVSEYAYQINTILLWRNEMLRRLDQRELPDSLHSHVRSLTIAMFRSRLKSEHKKSAESKRARKKAQREQSIRWANGDYRSSWQVDRDAKATAAEAEKEEVRPTILDKGKSLVESVRNMVS